MKKYKVKFIQTQRFVIDVNAYNEQQAIKKARKRLDTANVLGQDHYFQIGDTDIVDDAVYDVTHTDDPFNP